MLTVKLAISLLFVNICKLAAEYTGLDTSQLRNIKPSRINKLQRNRTGLFGRMVLSIAAIAVNYLLDKLKDFLENGVLFKDAEEEVTLVKRQLEYIRTFPRVADSLEESDEEVKVWVKQLREIAYDAEDALDEFKLLLAHDHGICSPGLLSRMSCCIKNMKGRYRIASQMKSINSRIRNIYDGHWRIHDKLKAEHHYGSSKPDDTWQDQRGQALLLDKAELVGVSEPTKQLVGWLVEGASTRGVISVVGMGGLWKTTLVKQVYEDPEVKKHFMIRAWITLSQSPNIEELLQGTVPQILRETQAPVPPLQDNMDTLCQRTIIKELLQKARYLIVVDDVWRINEWNAIKHALPNNSCGSQIIITPLCLLLSAI
ncbi:disease resistance protein RPM1-like [Eucalyptus grandis]|uniref:disease resistance protein RPM1-like n=1 Tax=Eucalyptus grandis TaxID=71139 RepID=UPI00192EB609|nr:disease resistance protein RPM1-like [Eucalyptus grandis]